MTPGAPPACSRVKNARTGQILPQYPDVLDDIERNAEALDIEAAAARIAVPWLIVHGSDDEAVALLEGERLAAAAPRRGAASCRSKGQGIRSAPHTLGRARRPELERVLDATLSFFAAELR